jgi:hypothetical protein
MYNLRTFPCPNCLEIINETMRACPHCAAPVDPEAAGAAAELQDKVNQACSDASYLRTAAVVMFGFLGLSLIPFVPLVFWGFLITFVAVVVLLVRWQSRFGRLQSADPDYAQARRSRNVALVLWVLAVPVGFVVRPLLGVIIDSMLFQ